MLEHGPLLPRQFCKMPELPLLEVWQPSDLSQPWQTWQRTPSSWTVWFSGCSWRTSVSVRWASSWACCQCWCLTSNRITWSCPHNFSSMAEVFEVWFGADGVPHSCLYVWLRSLSTIGSLSAVEVGRFFCWELLSSTRTEQLNELLKAPSKVVKLTCGFQWGKRYSPQNDYI